MPTYKQVSCNVYIVNSLHGSWGLQFIITALASASQWFIVNMSHSCCMSTFSLRSLALPFSLVCLRRNLDNFYYCHVYQVIWFFFLCFITVMNSIRNIIYKQSHIHLQIINISFIYQSPLLQFNFFHHQYLEWDKLK